MMLQLMLLPNLCLIAIFSLIRPSHATDYCSGSQVDTSSNYGTMTCNNTNGDTSGNHTYFVPASPNKKKRDVWDNSSFIPELYRYQVSPYFKPAAVLRQCSGSVVTTYDTKDANLNGRGQTVVSQRNTTGSCCSNGTQQPIELFSGLGASVRIIKEDIFFPGGVIHITDGWFTIPTLLSTTLSDLKLAAYNLFSLGFPAFDQVPSITAFISSDSALSAALQCSTLSAGDARTLLNAQIVKGSVAYSPLLVDGAFFQAANGEEITIEVKNGIKYANKIKIVQEDIVIENGVVHIIDGLFGTPPANCVTPKVCSTATTTSTLILPPVTTTITITPQISIITSTVTSTVILPPTTTVTINPPTPTIYVTPPTLTLTLTTTTSTSYPITVVSPAPPETTCDETTEPPPPTISTTTPIYTPSTPTLPIYSTPLTSISTPAPSPPTTTPTTSLASTYTPPPISTTIWTSITPIPETQSTSTDTECPEDESSWGSGSWTAVPTSIPTTGWVSNSAYTSRGPGGYIWSGINWRA